MKKTFTPLFLAACLAFAGCSKSIETTADSSASAAVSVSDSTSEGSSSNEAATEATEASEPVVASTGSAGNCDKFLADYEEFATSYAALSAKMAKDPSDMTVMSEYAEMATKAQEMQLNQPSDCQADAAFLKRYTSIAAKVTKAAAAQAAGSAKLMEQMSKNMN